jgi:hypothetical protein
MKEFLDYLCRIADEDLLKAIYTVVRKAKPSVNRTMILNWFDDNWFIDNYDDDMGPMPYEFGDK